MQTSSGSRLLKMSEVQSLTGFSLSKLYKTAARKELQTVRHNRSVRVPETALAAFLAAHTIDVASAGRAELCSLGHTQTAGEQKVAA